VDALRFFAREAMKAERERGENSLFISTRLQPGDERADGMERFQPFYCIGTSPPVGQAVETALALSLIQHRAEARR
jgi:hypothetical protein